MTTTPRDLTEHLSRVEAARILSGTVTVGETTVLHAEHVGGIESYQARCRGHVHAGHAVWGVD